MDLSNREAAAYWYKVAGEEPDPDLRKQALATHRKYLKMAESEERMRLRLLNPGYGVRSMFGWVVFVALVALAVLLLLSKAFSMFVVCTVFTLVFILFIAATAVTLKVYGHISPETMLEMFKLGLKSFPALGVGRSAIDLKAEVGDGAMPPQQLPPPTDAPTISFENDDI
jgi:hypothetical protein